METSKNKEKDTAIDNHDKDKTLSPFEGMSEGDMWEWNLIHGIGNDIY